MAGQEQKTLTLVRTRDQIFLGRSGNEGLQNKLRFSEPMPSRSNATTPGELVSSSPPPSNPYPAGSRAVVFLPISTIFVDPAHRSEAEDVALLDGSIGVLGLRTPITVRPRNRSGDSENSPTFDVVTGHARLAAMMNLGRDRIDAFIDMGDEIDARLWGIAEDIDRRVPSVIEVAEKSEEFDRLLQQKLKEVVQVAPRGGEQPHDKGIRKAAKRLGISREKMRRRRLISGLSPEAKAHAGALGLHDNQSALLEAAKEETAAAQAAKVREIAARKTARAQKRQSSGLSPKADERPTGVVRAADRAELSSLKGQLREKTNEIADLKADLRVKVNLVKQLEAELAASRRNESPAIAVIPPKVLPDADDYIPAFLSRCPLSPENETHFAGIMAEWKKSAVRTILIGVSALVQERFIKELRADIGSARAPSS